VRVANARGELERARQALTDAALRRLDAAQRSLELERHRLTLLSPQSVLARGYAIAIRNGRAVTSASALDEGDEFRLVLADGSVRARTIEKQTEVRNREE